MRIAFVAQPPDRMVPPVKRGSLALWTYYMARILAGRGHDVCIVAKSGTRFSTRETRHDGIHYIFTPTALNAQVNRLGNLLMRLGRPFGLGRHPMAKAHEGWHDSVYARHAAIALADLDVDVIHIQNCPHLVPAIRRRHPRTLLALHMHCEWLTQFPRPYVDARLREVDLMIGCSEYITRTVAEAFPDHAHKCVAVPNSADPVPERDAPPTEPHRVLFVGRVSPEKGIHDLIDAFHQVLSRCPEARLHIVGGAGSVPLEFLVGLSDVDYVKALARFYPASDAKRGDEDAYFTELKRRAGSELGKRIHFEGRVDHSQISDHYRKASLLVNPSLSESFGISLIEAMMLGKPVVATRVGGMQYTVIQETTGLLVEPANPAALADAIQHILLDPALGRRMGEAGRERAHRCFSWESSADRLLEVYTSRR